MSKSKSKSKSKQATFPDQYWRLDFEIYTYYPNLFGQGKELLKAAVQEPPEQGDAITKEIEALLEKQRRLNDHFDERERRREEIEWEIDHLSRGYQSALLTSPEAYPKTWQLMNTMNDLALVPVMHFKKRFARARPNQIEPRIEPLIEVPGHPAYPSGHSTQNFLIAHVLSEVIGDDAELVARVFAIARRVAENREWAGVHYSSDTEAGEELAREIFPIMKRAFAEPIKEAIEEWQELELEHDRKGAPNSRPYVVKQLGKGAESDDPLSISHFHKHQWNLENVGQTNGKPGVDINVIGAWEELRTWQGGPAPEKPVRVALIDLAIDFDHPALRDRLDFQGAVNLDYPRLSKDDRARYADAFRSFSSAHAIACAGIIAADKPQLEAVRGRTKSAPEAGCLGIAPHSRIVPLRAMTLGEAVLKKRQFLARAVLQAVTGHTFIEKQRSGEHGRTAYWEIGEEMADPVNVLLFPLPLEPLPEGSSDPLPLALAFAATRIPVIIPSGNKGTSSLSYPLGSDGHGELPQSLDRLSELFALDVASVRAILGPVGKNRQASRERDEKILEDLASNLRTEAAVICVGACNDKGRRSRYSQYGPSLTVVAPSDDVLPLPQEVENGARVPPSIATTDLKGIGGYMQDRSNYTLSDNEFGFGGTSAAAAQVAGVVALLLEANSNLSPKDVWQILCDTARVEDEQRNVLLESDDGSPSPQLSAEFGYGLIDATSAIRKALGKVPQVAAAPKRAYASSKPRRSKAA